jgi:hypothetical protein
LSILTETLISIAMVDWRFGSRKSADATVINSGTDLQPEFLKEGGLTFALEKAENDSGLSYREFVSSSYF